MTSSFGNIIGTQRDQIPKPVIPNYAQTEPNLEKAVNDEITKNQADLKQFGEELAQIQELKAKNFFDNLSGLESLVGKVSQFAQAREANREARETRKKFREMSKESKQRVLDYQFRLQDADKAEKEALLRELAKEDQVAFELLKAQYFPDVEEIDFQETKDRFDSLVGSSYNTNIEDNAIYEQNTESQAVLISENGIELVLTNFYLELVRKGIDINSGQVQRYVNRNLLPKLIKEQENALRTWKQGSYNRYEVRRDTDIANLFVDAVNSSEAVTTTDEFGQTVTNIQYNGVFDAPEGEGGLFEIAMKKLGFKKKSQAVEYFTNLATNPSIAGRLDPGGLLYFLNDATFIDSRTGNIVEGYLNSTFSNESIRRGNVKILNDIIDKIIKSDDVAYASIVKRYNFEITEFKKANGNEISLGQLAVFESKFYADLDQAGLSTDLPPPSFFTGDETSSQGNESYSVRVGQANKLPSGSKFKQDWEQLLKNEKDPFPALRFDQLLAIPGAEAELAKRVYQTMDEENISIEQAITRHYLPVLKELKDGKFAITSDILRITSKTDIENDINSFKVNTSEWLNNEVPNSIFEKRALMEYVKYKDGRFKGAFPTYLEKIAEANNMTGRQYAIARMRALGLLSESNKFSENPEDLLELNDEDKKFLYLNSNATKNLMLLNTTDDNRSNEKALLDALKIKGRSVEYFEGKGFVSSVLDNLGSGQTIRTVQEVYDLAKKGKATNFGLYGFSAEELIASVDSGAISLDADFNEDTQSLMAIELVRVQANNSNSIMGALTEADKDWRRLSDLNEIEKAAVLRFFPSLRNMPMNQFHNLQQDIANVFLTEMETLNKEFVTAEVGVDATQFKDKKALIKQIRTPNLVFDSKERIEETIKIRQYYEEKIRKGEEVDAEIRRVLQATRPIYINVPFGDETYSANRFNYFEQPNTEK
tara:strand:+ start:60 stop:2870 length:2811 start_codon:yes stop_codon:yes gene_type:complete